MPTGASGSDYYRTICPVIRKTFKFQSLSLEVGDGVFSVFDANGNAVSVLAAGTKAAIVLNGTTQYASKSSPTNLDPSGPERITTQQHRDFEGTKRNNATVLNGTSQKWSKTSPANLDFNGSELATNGTFEVDASGWTAFFGGGITRSTVQFKSGVASGLLTQNSSSNAYVTNTAIANTSTNKFTLEVWMFCPSTNTSKSVSIEIGS